MYCFGIVTFKYKCNYYLSIIGKRQAINVWLLLATARASPTALSHIQNAHPPPTNTLPPFTNTAQPSRDQLSIYSCVRPTTARVRPKPPPLAAF